MKLPAGITWDKLAAMSPEEIKEKGVWPAGFLPLPHPTRPDLGDVSKGKLVTLMNYYELFNGILNPKQLEGLRLLVTPFPQQQFNLTSITDAS